MANDIDTSNYRGPNTLGQTIDGAANGAILGIVSTVAFSSTKKFRSMSQTALWGVSGALAAVFGYLGYSRAKAGEDQFNALKTKNEQLAATLSNVSTAQVASQQRWDQYQAGLNTPKAMTSELAASPVSVEEPVIKTPTIAPAPTTKDLAATDAASPVSIEEPPIKEPVIKTPTIAPAPTTKSFAENAPAPAHEHGGHAAAVEASQQAASHAQATL